jgi:hypothetical protein
MSENKNMQVRLLYDHVLEDWCLVPLSEVYNFLEVQNWFDDNPEDEDQLTSDYYDRLNELNDKYHIEKFDGQIFEMINSKFDSI